MSHPTKDSEKFYMDRLRPFIGKKVEGILVDRVTDPPFVFLGFTFDNGTGIWFLSDDEGNAPGSFETVDLAGEAT